LSKPAARPSASQYRLMRATWKPRSVGVPEIKPFVFWAAVSELGAPGLTDELREERVRRAALRALAGTGQLFLRIAGMVCATLAPVWLADAAGLAPAGAVAGFALRLDVAIATTVCAILLVAAGRRLGRTRS